MANVVYIGAKEKMGEGGFNPVAQDARVLLLIGTSSTPDNPDHEFVADIAADEATDPSYGRLVLGTKTGTRNLTNDRWEFDFADPVFNNLAGATIVFAILFVQVTTDSDSWLISAHDIANTDPDGTDFTLVVGSTGALHIT